jgi:hypothetical protein
VLETYVIIHVVARFLPIPLGCRRLLSFSFIISSIVLAHIFAFTMALSLVNYFYFDKPVRSYLRVAWETFQLSYSLKGLAA